jgi:hypothetical protein
LRVGRLIIALFAGAAWASIAFAQSDRVPAPADCPPDVKGDAPTIGRGRPSESLSDKLAESKGVICPPAGVDPDIHVKPPAGGELKVIPPPGSPGGDPNVQPK